MYVCMYGCMYIYRHTHTLNIHELICRKTRKDLYTKLY